MPELPEVETVKNGLDEVLKPPTKVKRALRRREDLRFPMPKKLEQKLKGAEIQSVERKAKYIFFHLKDGVMVNHLGMTGSWREGRRIDLEKHDHFFFELEDGRYLIYHDPRRFGLIEWASSIDEYWRKKGYGPEPLSRAFDAEYLWQKTRKKTVAMKTLIMDQKTVVGIGNIYASETLFRAQVRPMRRAGKVTRKEVEAIVKHSKDVLKEAIQAGGSTISDFKQAGGQEGYFQHNFQVYGREGESCVKCSDKIKMKVITGRSSFYCPSCQR